MKLLPLAYKHAATLAFLTPVAVPPTYPPVEFPAGSCLYEVTHVICETADVIDVWSYHAFIRTDIQMTSDSCLLYTSPSPRDGLLSRMPSSA